MRSYIKGLLDTYQRDYDRSSNVIGGLLREQGKRGDEVIRAKGWSKVGGVFVNSTDPGQGTMEIIFQLMNEMKVRITKTEEVLKFFDMVENLPTPGDSTFLLFLRVGVPERIIVDSDVKRPEKFGYKAILKTV